MLDFLKHLIGIKTRDLAQEATNLLATLDTDAAIQADLRVMEDDLDAAGKLIAELRAAYNREVQEFEAVEKRYQQHFTAAESLQVRLQAAPEAEKAAINTGLNELVDLLEKLVPEMEKEKQDVVEAEALLREAEKAYQEKGAALKKARSDLENARRDLKRAEIDADRAKAQAEQAARVAGLRDKSGQQTGLRVGFNAMTEKAAALRQQAESQRMKSQVLKDAPASTNSYVQQALNDAAGKGTTDSRSAVDRLAALKK
ncbi:hypothetical protein [Insolitispirillum peregrinum]|uniref:Phage shock protein A (PspA) family protein n=1 Tax=Insolitispirillum peregrinum TaxID=80876 RepID=A0A1N7MUE2_9PROT|nr:hypothetical protein [Insolitispirillum peregrinum]SIS89743.1 hypothetical protein SAMN05421779_104364 [Insolitispirillum peregrinum]